MKLYVDDIRIAPEGWTQAWNAAEALAILKNGEVTELSLDHDLGSSRAPTGYDIMLWIEEQALNAAFQLPSIKFHTANPVGRANMIASYRVILNRRLSDK